ncbi:MAG: hypothetical protein LBK68_03095 [Candidatus Margulisbacteria bacterium]|jgi:hypothetical protein|nr:hypothetical protein [Candidatus Margulisiibacteriota bacterium]
MENKYLDPKEAIRLMLSGETLVDSCYRSIYWDRETFIRQESSGKKEVVDYFSDLWRNLQKQKRQMTKWECLVWANSDWAKGWVVRFFDRENYYSWKPPQMYYYDEPEKLHRARFDTNGIDESTITDFMVEVN